MVRNVLRNLYQGPIAPQLRRFVAVGIVAATVQLVLLWTFVDVAGAHYLIGTLVAIEITIVLSYVLNNAWTFRSVRHTELGTYVVGLVKTNVVRGTAIPLQLTVLALLVEFQITSYLAGNVVAIGISGIYRYVLDARWTWG